MTEKQSFALAVTVVGDDRASVLSIVSMLHRRAIDVRELAMTSPFPGRRSFSATIVASQRQACVVASSLRNLVDVVAVDVCEAPHSNRGPLGLHSRDDSDADHTAPAVDVSR